MVLQQLGARYQDRSFCRSELSVKNGQKTQALYVGKSEYDLRGRAGAKTPRCATLTAADLSAAYTIVQDA